MGVVARIHRLGAVAEPVERRKRQIEPAGADHLGHGAVEEGDEQAGDMGAVNIGVRHDHHAFIAQVFFPEFRSALNAQGEQQVGELLVLAQLVQGGGGDVQDLAAQRQDRLGLTVPRLLGRTAGAVAFDEENLGAVDGAGRAVRQLAGQPELAGGRGAGDFLVAAAFQPLLGPLDDEFQQGRGDLGLGRQPMVEGIAKRGLDQSLGVG